MHTYVTPSMCAVLYSNSVVGMRDPPSHSFLMIAPGHSTLEISDSSLAGQTLTWGENLTRLSPHVRVWPARLQ